MESNGNDGEEKVEPLDQIAKEFILSFYMEHPVTCWLTVFAIFALLLSMFSQLGGR